MNPIQSQSNAVKISPDSLKKFLEIISDITYIESVKLEYAKENSYTQRYKKGGLKAIKYFQEISYHYFLKEKLLKQTLIEDIQEQLALVDMLDDSEYKDGIVDVFNKILNEMMVEEGLEFEECS